MNTHFLSIDKAALLIVDVQERLFPHIDRSVQVLDRILFTMKWAKILGIPLFSTEQLPEKLGPTITAIQKELTISPWPKSTFSAYRCTEVKKALESKEDIIVMGIEAHVCILQTVKDLLQDKKRVVVLNDAISARTIYDFSSAINEIKEAGGRISNSETILYELLGDATHPKFKEVLPLIKGQ